MFGNNEEICTCWNKILPDTQDCMIIFCSWHLLETAFHFRPDATSGSSSVANRPRFTLLSQKSSHVPKIFPFFSRALFNYLQRQKGFSPIMYLLSVCSPRPGSLGCPATAAQATPPSTWPPSQQAPPPTQLLHRSPTKSITLRAAPPLRQQLTDWGSKQQQQPQCCWTERAARRRGRSGPLHWESGGPEFGSKLRPPKF